MTDYAHTRDAAKRRLEKAQALSRWCWEQGVSAAQQDLWSDDEWTLVCKTAIGRLASADTRLVVYGILVYQEARAAAGLIPAHAAITDEQAKALAAPAAPARRPVSAR